MKTVRDYLKFYRTRHLTPGCKLTHLIGLPLLVAVPFAWLFIKDRRVVRGCLLFGVLLQLAGHAIFEKNQPTLIETKNWKVIPASLLFIFGEWLDVFRGQWFSKNGLSLWSKVSPADRADLIKLP